jgi:hypothetical protein
MNIIFLDHDGVICLSEQWGKRKPRLDKWITKNGDSKIPPHIIFDPFDYKSIKILNNILDITGADIVVSSDWRLYSTLEEMSELYKFWGIIKSPIGFTPDANFIEGVDLTLNSSTIRDIEIMEWLRINGPISKWVAIDDMPLNLENFVRTPRPNEGIKQCGVSDKIIKYLI